MNKLTLKYPLGTSLVHNNRIMRIFGVSIASFGEHYHLIDRNHKSYVIPVNCLKEDNCELIGMSSVEPQILEYKFAPRDMVEYVGDKIGLNPLYSRIVSLEIYEGLKYKYIVSMDAQNSYYTEEELKLSGETPF